MATHLPPRTTPRPTPPRAPTLLAAALLLGAGCSGSKDPAAPSTGAGAATTPPGDNPAGPPEDPIERLRGLMSPHEHALLSKPRGVQQHLAGAFEGYTLVMPLVSQKVHLVDLAGDVVHTWDTGFAPGGWCYLLDDGSLLHAGREDKDPQFRGGGIGGVIRRLAPNGDVLWRYDFADSTHCQHHDLEPLPNGNLLFIAWERLSEEKALAIGRRPGTVDAPGLWPDAVFEVRPTPPVGGEIVWSWHAKDHLVQDFDPTKPNFGKAAEHRGRIDINFDFVPAEAVDPEAERLKAEREKQMAALGYGGGGDDDDEADADADTDQGGAPKDAPKPPPGPDREKTGDWMHTNAVDYDAVHDLIVLSSRELCQIFILDHSTTTAEAATSKGGRYGRGGDLLWRWGNPAFEGLGGPADQRLFYQHDPNFLPGTKPGELRVLVFNNGGDRPDGKNRSEVLELVLPFDPATGFACEPGKPFGPAEPAWSYEDAATFFSAFISGARRLSNGNTLVCSGAAGRIFEVTPAKELVWDYTNPHGGDFEAPDHAGKAPPLALYRADRYAPNHPGIVALGLN